MNEEKLSKKEQREHDRQRKEDERNKRERAVMRKKILFGAGLVAIVVGIVVVAVLSKPEPGTYTNPYPDPTLGPDTAPVVIEEFGDFQCPSCAAAHPVVKDILKEYGDKIHFVHKDFPLPQHKFATDAAVGGQCALAQNKFWEYHDLLFKNQDSWVKASKNNDEAQAQFRKYAEKTGMDMGAFDQCVSQQEMADRVNADLAEGNARQVNATPSFFVNGEKVSTEESFSVGLHNAIEAALKKNETDTQTTQ